MYTVYIIEDDSHLRYVGQTQNLEKRLESHNLGLSLYTKRGKNWKMIYKEEYATRSDAMKREKYLKSGKGRDELKKLLGS